MKINVCLVDACFFPIKAYETLIRKLELKNNLNMSRLRLKQIDNKIEFEKSKNYVRVIGSVHEYFGIPHSTYLACNEDLKSKICCINL